MPVKGRSGINIEDMTLRDRAGITLQLCLMDLAVESRLTRLGSFVGRQKSVVGNVASGLESMRFDLRRTLLV